MGIVEICISLLNSKTENNVTQGKIGSSFGITSKIKSSSSPRLLLSGINQILQEDFFLIAFKFREAL